jgi:replicative DNA helicase Mcm
LPPTLINRFDLIFPIKDLPSREKDNKLASFILKLHQDPDLAVAKVESDVLKKYFLYVRRFATPFLSDEAIKEIKEYYISMRNSGGADEGGVSSVPITARQLEALVRLAEASAKLRLAKTVNKEDALKSIELVDYCLNQIAKDEETGRIDIDRISSKITSTQRSKISLIKEIIGSIESSTKDRIIPIELIIQEAANKKISSEEVEDVLEKLRRSGDVFEPKRGFIQKL